MAYILLGIVTVILFVVLMVRAINVVCEMIRIRKTPLGKIKIRTFDPNDESWTKGF